MSSALLLEKTGRPHLPDFAPRKELSAGLVWVDDKCFDLLVSYKSVYRMLALGMFQYISKIYDLCASMNGPDYMTATASTAT
jgi:hypothetical protein